MLRGNRRPTARRQPRPGKDEVVPGMRTILQPFCSHKLVAAKLGIVEWVDHIICIASFYGSALTSEDQSTKTPSMGPDRRGRGDMKTRLGGRNIFKYHAASCRIAGCPFAVASNTKAKAFGMVHRLGSKFLPQSNAWYLFAPN